MEEIGIEEEPKTIIRRVKTKLNGQLAKCQVEALSLSNLSLSRANSG
jgi:hypothetical protein